MAQAQPEIPPQVQDQLLQLQNLQQQLQVAVQQRQQFEFQVREAERAVEELGKVEAETPIFRNVGSLLIRTQGRDAVKAQLEEDLETLRVRLGGVEKQEGRLKEKATELQSRLQAAIRNLSVGSKDKAGKD